MKLGDTFLLKSSNGILHLHIVLSDPQKNSKVVIVPVTTRTEYDDDRAEMVIRSDSGHSFIKHESFVFYSNAQVIPHEKLEKYARMYPNLLREPLSAEILRQTIRIAGTTTNFENDFWRILDDQHLFDQ